MSPAILLSMHFPEPFEPSFYLQITMRPSTCLITVRRESRLLMNVGQASTVKILALLKTTGWVLQILAHKFFEGRAPAFLDNASTAFTMAPYFVLLELMFGLGYKPKLQQQIDSEANRLRTEFENSSKKK